MTMTPELLRSLQNQRDEVWSNLQGILERAERRGRGLTKLEQRQWAATEKLLGQLAKEIEGNTRDVYGVGQRPAGNDGREHERAFTDFLRRGVEGMAPADRALLEHRAQAESSGGSGGYLVPQGYWTRISEVMKSYGGLLSIANVVRTTTGQPLPWPNNDDTSHIGHILGENVQVTETDLTIGTRMLNAWTYTSDLVLVSLELLQDSAFDLETWITRMLGIRLARGVAGHLISGTGTGQPLGIGAAPTVGVTGATGQTTSIIYDNVVDLVHSVDPAYRAGGNCRFLMADTTLAALRKIKDNFGHPLWQPSVASDDPDFVLGYPLTIDNDMPAMAPGALSILFGDFEAGYVVRQVLDVQMVRLVERYADYLQVGFMGYLRLDARPDDANAVKAYQNSAS